MDIMCVQQPIARSPTKQLQQYQPASHANLLTFLVVSDSQNLCTLRWILTAQFKQRFNGKGPIIDTILLKYG